MIVLFFRLNINNSLFTETQVLENYPFFQYINIIKIVTPIVIPEEAPDCHSRRLLAGIQRFCFISR